VRDHQGRTAIVTGAGSGIGRAIATRLASEGAAIAVLDVNEAGAAETIRMITSAGGRASFVYCDVANRDVVHEAVSAAVDTLGSLTYLVNNAGVVTMSGLADVTQQEWDFVLGVNLTGPFLVTQAAAPHLKAAGGGAVVNLSTVEASVVVASGPHCQPHYNASKGGIPMLTKALAVELSAQGTRVNAIAPGPINTRFTGGDISGPEAMEFMKTRLLIPRVGEPADIAAAASFLLSDDASYITGIELPVDGGWLTR
jgi:glucose 1-dehydrogenase/3-oxoacyl-[acyl-carrier protein] reductase